MEQNPEDVGVKAPSKSPAPVSLTPVTEFDWPTFCDERSLVSVPDGSFAHVESSLDTGVRENMVVELPFSPDSDVYWLAVVEQVYGPLLKLRHVGDPKEGNTIWHDLGKNRLYPLGWCQMNKFTLEPTPELKKACPEWNSLAIQYLEVCYYNFFEL